MNNELTQKLTRKQRNIYSILSNGNKHSVADLSILTHYSDPRSLIKTLRDKGINILDEWKENAEKDGRYKVYFIKN